jgi:hypothetical protein
MSILTRLAPDPKNGVACAINVLHQHPAIQPNNGEEVYGRVLAGLDPNSDII